MPALAEWEAIKETLDPEWDDVVLSFVPEQGAMNAAAGVLAPLGPGRLGRELRVHVRRGGGGVDRLENLLGRLDRKRVWGELALVEAHVTPGKERVAEEPAARRALVAQWDEAVAELPPGWRDVLAELELDSTDFLAQAALAGSPLNPSRIPARSRSASGSSDAASAATARRPRWRDAASSEWTPWESRASSGRSRRFRTWTTSPRRARSGASPAEPFERSLSDDLRRAAHAERGMRVAQEPERSRPRELDRPRLGSAIAERLCPPVVPGRDDVDVVVATAVAHGDPVRPEPSSA